MPCRAVVVILHFYCLILRRRGLLCDTRAVRATEASAALGTITPALLEPFGRLLALLDEPGAIAVLAPLIEREIHYRLLMSDQAARLWQIASVGSQSHRIAKVID